MHDGVYYDYDYRPSLSRDIVFGVTVDGGVRKVESDGDGHDVTAAGVCSVVTVREYVS